MVIWKDEDGCELYLGPNHVHGDEFGVLENSGKNARQVIDVSSGSGIRNMEQEEIPALSISELPIEQRFPGTKQYIGANLVMLFVGLFRIFFRGEGGQHIGEEVKAQKETLRMNFIRGCLSVSSC